MQEYETLYNYLTDRYKEFYFDENYSVYSIEDIESFYNKKDMVLKKGTYEIVKANYEKIIDSNKIDLS
jgi:hypothetical protein